MTNYIGWDVGAWHCQNRTAGKPPKKKLSFDAVVVLVEELGSLVVKEAWAGNMALNWRQGQVSLPTAVARDDEAVVAADATFGWPLAFTELLRGTTGPCPNTGGPEIDNHYLYRVTERRLAPHLPKANPPMSAVADMIGNHSTKAMHYLAQSGFLHDPKRPGTWRLDGSSWVAIETYPAAVARLGAQIPGPQFNDIVKNDKVFNAEMKKHSKATSDLKDALWCALVAWMWKRHHSLLDAPAHSLGREAAMEGWIWTPKLPPVVLASTSQAGGRQ